MQRTMHNAQCTTHNAQCTMHNAQYIPPRSGPCRSCSCLHADWVTCAVRYERRTRCSRFICLARASSRYRYRDRSRHGSDGLEGLLYCARSRWVLDRLATSVPRPSCHHQQSTDADGTMVRSKSRDAMVEPPAKQAHRWVISLRAAPAPAPAPAPEPAPEPAPAAPAPSAPASSGG